MSSVPTNYDFQDILLISLPFLGLLLGAIFPPFRYARRPWLAFACNIIGFIIYMFSFVMLAAVFYFVAQIGSGDPQEPLSLMTLSLFAPPVAFAGIEALVFLLLWLRRRCTARKA